MNTKKRIIILSLFLLAPLAFGSNSHIQYAREFVGGLNISQITSCEKQYENDCRTVNAKTAMDGVSQQWRCMERKMAKNKFCAQASKIRQLTFYPATDIRKYGLIAVFDITTLADGINTYYMVDTHGSLISLDSDLNLGDNKNYFLLKKKYPGIALTKFLYWTKVNENLFPKSHTLPNKNQQLIFRQELRDGECVACPRIGIADIAYEFDQYGVYLRSKLLKITMLP